jgi:predicted DCC family thiol-disulfide oxidoreductase YuxK
MDTVVKQQLHHQGKNNNQTITMSIVHHHQYLFVKAQACYFTVRALKSKWRT